MRSFLCFADENIYITYFGMLVACNFLAISGHDCVNASFRKIPLAVLLNIPFYKDNCFSRIRSIKVN
jgi:hypothetical protein